MTIIVPLMHNEIGSSGQHAIMDFCEGTYKTLNIASHTNINFNLNINECARNSDYCNINAKFDNTIDPFTCTYNIGLKARMNGEICEGNKL